MQESGLGAAMGGTWNPPLCKGRWEGYWLSNQNLPLPLLAKEGLHSPLTLHCSLLGWGKRGLTIG